MRIAYIAAGAAGMYCGSCLHDNTLAAALMKLGEDVVLLPTYTPIRTDEEDVSHKRVFYGGINVYLQQKSSLFRHTPWWFDRWLDHPALLQRLSKRAGTIDASQLGEMTVSMLEGELGRQHKEIEKLTAWLANDFKPDVVHLSNAMLAGMARMLKQKLDVPIVCTLSGEDVFLERIPPPHYEQARQGMRERARDIDAFVALNNYYADYMVDYLAIDRESIRVVPHGLNLDGHGPRPSNKSDCVPTVGYMARICHDKGLHVLVEACEHVAKDHPNLEFRLHFAGYLGEAEKMYLAEQERRLRRGPLAKRYEYVGELNREQKLSFLQSLHVFSVPTVYRESKGLPALEAMANCVPVVLPDHGSFSELIADTQGGVLHRPLDAKHLAEKLAELLAAPDDANAIGRRGREAIIKRYTAQTMAEATMELYQSMQ